MLKQFLSILVFTLPGLALADTHIEFSDGTFMKITGGAVAMGDNMNEMQFKEGNSEFVAVDHREKTYMVIEKESLKKNMNAMQAQIEAQLADIPPEQREMVKQMMKQRMPQMVEPEKVTYSVRDTGQKGEAAGYKCEVKELLANGQPESRVCVASAGETGVPRSDIAVLQSAMNTMRELAESLPFSQSSNLGEMDFDELGGIPIIYTDLSTNESNEVASISTDSLPPISVPEGFRRQSMEELMRQ
ncbi:MAG: hypothetical protein AAF438_17980 [Pseudomonadota bacterium]